MRWPWSSRIGEAQKRADEARLRLDGIREQWEDVRTVVGQSRERQFTEDHLTRLFKEGRRGSA